MDGFLEAIRVLCKFVVVFVGLSGCNIYFYSTLQTGWLKELTSKMISEYVKTGLFATKAMGLENPDERVTNTVGQLIDSVLGLVIQTVMSVIKCLAFLAMLYRLMPQALTLVVTMSLFDTIVTCLLIGPPIRLAAASRSWARVRERAARRSSWGPRRSSLVARAERRHLSVRP